MRQQFQAEAARITSQLRAAHQAGTLPSEAIAQAQQSVQDGQDDWAALFADAFSTISQDAGDRLFTQFVSEGVLPAGTTYDPTRAGSQVADALKTQPAATARQIIDTTTSALDGQLRASIDGSEMQPIIDGIQAQYDDWLQGRTNTIADTEVVKGWSLGQLDAAFQAADVTGAQATRTWVSMGDNHVRPAHADADGQEVGIDEPFDVGGESLMYPCDPGGSPDNTVNCRCSVDYSLTLQTGQMGDDGNLADAKASARQQRRQDAAVFRAFREVTLG